MTFDGRSKGDVPPTSLTLTAGWSGSVTCERRNGIVTVIVHAAKPTYGANEAIATLPAGCSPSGTLALTGLNSTGDNSVRSWAIAGSTVQSAAAGTSSIWGAISFVGH